MSNTLDEITHYYRVCNTCGYGWWGLHCPHDGYQNNCGNCNTRPTILPGDLCKCEFVADVEQIQALIDESKGCVDCKTPRCENCERLWQT